MACLVNETLVPEEKLLKFYQGAMVHWYETLFLNGADEAQRNDPQRFPELKKLYSRLTKMSHTSQLTTPAPRNEQSAASDTQSVPLSKFSPQRSGLQLLATHAAL